MKLKAELKKVKEVARVAQVVVEASEQRSYDLGVQETKARLTEELAGVCREYCQKVWVKGLNLAGVLATLDLRRDENIYYPKDLREVPAAPLGPETDAAVAATVLGQLLSP